jgi:hypothetical protein
MEARAVVRQIEHVALPAQIPSNRFRPARVCYNIISIQVQGGLPCLLNFRALCPGCPPRGLT